MWLLGEKWRKAEWVGGGGKTPQWSARYMQIFAFCTWHMCQVLIFYFSPVCFSLNEAEAKGKGSEKLLHM